MMHWFRHRMRSRSCVLGDRKGTLLILRQSEIGLVPHVCRLRVAKSHHHRHHTRARLHTHTHTHTHTRTQTPSTGLLHPSWRKAPKSDARTCTCAHARSVSICFIRLCRNFIVLPKTIHPHITVLVDGVKDQVTYRRQAIAIYVSKSRRRNQRSARVGLGLHKYSGHSRMTHVRTRGCSKHQHKKRWEKIVSASNFVRIRAYGINASIQFSMWRRHLQSLHPHLRNLHDLLTAFSRTASECTGVAMLILG